MILIIGIIAIVIGIGLFFFLDLEQTVQGKITIKDYEDIAEIETLNDFIKTQKLELSQLIESNADIKEIEKKISEIGQTQKDIDKKLDSKKLDKQKIEKFKDDFNYFINSPAASDYILNCENSPLTIGNLNLDLDNQAQIWIEKCGIP